MGDNYYHGDIENASNVNYVHHTGHSAWINIQTWSLHSQKLLNAHFLGFFSGWPSSIFRPIRCELAFHHCCSWDHFRWDASSTGQTTHTFFFVCSYFKYWPSNTCIFICALYYENIWEGTFPALQTYANIWQTWNCRRSAKNPRLAPKLAVQAKRRWWELLCIIYSLIVADLEFGIFDLYTVPYVCTILYGQPIELISTLYHVTWRVLMRFHFWFDIIINCIGGFYLYHDRHLE